MPSRKLAERTPLTRDRVLRTAMELADRDGLDALTMRRLADELGVEAMSLYYHLPNKNAILDGVIELTFSEIEAEVGGFAAPADKSWQPALRARILDARRVLLRHPWVPPVMESRGALAPTMARYIDGVVGIMQAGGLSNDLIHHAMHALGSRMYGFVQEMKVENDDSGMSGSDLAQMADFVPHLAAMLAEVVHDDPASTLGWCDDQTEFEFGLDLLLDGLEARRTTPHGTRP
ncbi:MAG TPA: TetR/AcrR family transcriptional regulator C-terminal domain-containing protein [Microbacterium sp.]|uniref:TetR/AcrR family transcriptional regulator n=1 Tax=Microbacterium sp. TaxID=51671 RepID=UPI002BDF5C36|nr:TetR/AcrR family transcriptional regulator C-terminal domain-containing protein [Microbacterium sp.]HWI30303.1 TetR/AcrR family transcriptional regulator C-terminal domain-containing protein [Microbacterium sp.]